MMPARTPWMGTLTLALLFAAVLAGVGPALDGAHARLSEPEHPPEVQAAINAAIERGRFEAAAQALCGPNAAWAGLPDGSVQCRTKHGRPTITVQVSP